MSLLDTIRSFFKPASSSDGGRFYIVDAAKLHRKSGGRLAPGDQIQTLHALSRFAKKEGITLNAVFEGKPLRAVGHGEEFRGVKVFFASTKEELPGLILKLFKQANRRHEVMVITSDQSVEDQVGKRGGKTMRATTFARGLEGSLTRNGRNGNRRGNRRNNSQGRDRDNRDRDEERGEGSRNNRRRNSKKRGPKKPSGDRVSDLIDTID